MLWYCKPRTSYALVLQAAPALSNVS